MRTHTRTAAGLVLAVLCLLSAPVSWGEDQAQPYEKIRYPTFANGRLQSLLEADQAEAYDLTAGTPRINLKNVVITLYDHTDEVVARTPDDQPLPVKMTITSERGYFTRRPPEPGAEPEDIANLEGNVVLRQMRVHPEPPRQRLRKPNLDPSIETEIRCEHAQWNNSLRKLNGDGDVEFIQEDSRILGTGFLYLADDEALEAGSSTSNIKDWGGIIFIEHNARMIIERADFTDYTDNPGASGHTEITCRDTASYKLREREIQFERDVKITRPGLVIESDILKVFLRREDDPIPEGTAGNLNPGQVKNIVATIGNRPGSVVVTGYRFDEVRGIEVPQYTARGGRADFDYDTNRITLTDTREQRWPEVEFGADRDRISDGNLIFVFTQVKTPDANARSGGGGETVLDSLSTSGGRGEVILRSRRGDDNGPIIPTIVNYRGEMSYNRVDGRIRFQQNVTLRRDDLYISSQILDLRLSSDGTSVEPNQVNRILAEEDVELRSGVYQARAQRAEYDIYSGPIGPVGTGLDTLRLFGPPQATPPHPWIRDQEGNQISAPEIHMQRLTTEAGFRDQHLMVARGGTSVCDFVTGGTNAQGQTRAKVVSIKCERGMEYNQSSKKARFEGQVIVTSDSPEDSYVLTSDRLLLDFEESPDQNDPNEYVTWIRRITAEGNARLLQDARVCEAINIIRDFPSQDPKEGDIYLQGAVGQGGQPPQMAVLREQNGEQLGAMFAAPLIKSSATGDIVQANGPGQLSMPDEATDALTGRQGRSEIHFDGAASYEAMQGGVTSIARFWGGVVLRQPARNVVVMSDEMDARFYQEDNQTGALANTTGAIELERIGTLRMVEGRFNVRLEHLTNKGGRRVAVGDVGVVEFTPTGNILRLTADRSVDSRRFVMTRDFDGLTLRSPEVEVREAQGITRAAGPGDLQIPGDRTATGMSGTPTRILYGENGSLVYNELALSINVSDNVRIVQPGPNENWSYPSLDGICERMDITLYEPPAVTMTGDDALSRVRKMDAIGSVLLRVYAPPPPDNPGLDWLSRPGTTFFTRGDQAEYNVSDGLISIFCHGPTRQPQLLLNMVEGPNSRPRRQRLRADRFVLQTNAQPRRWNFEGQLESNAINEGEPFDFID